MTLFDPWEAADTSTAEIVKPSQGDRWFMDPRGGQDQEWSDREAGMASDENQGYTESGAEQSIDVS